MNRGWVLDPEARAGTVLPKLNLRPKDHFDEGSDDTLASIDSHPGAGAEDLAGRRYRPAEQSESSMVLRGGN